MPVNAPALKLFAAFILGFSFALPLGLLLRKIDPRPARTTSLQEEYSQLQDWHMDQRRALTEKARRDHQNGDSTLLDRLDADLKETHEKYKIKVRTLYREFGQIPPEWSME